MYLSIQKNYENVDLILVHLNSLVYNVRLRITVIHDYKKTYKHMPLLLASLQTHASIGNIPCIVIRVHVLLTIFGYLTLRNHEVCRNRI